MAQNKSGGFKEGVTDVSGHPDAIQIKAKAMSDTQASVYTPGGEDDTVAVVAFGIFSTEEFKKMNFSGCSPVVMIGRGMDQKPVLEPFFVIGEAEDVKLMVNGFFSGVFNAYKNGQLPHNDEQGVSDEGSKAGQDVDNG